MADEARVACTKGVLEGKEFTLKGTATVFGRLESCDIPVLDGTASRTHARIELKDDTYWLEDLKSGNGTQLNGRKIERESLKDGDTFSIGDTVFRFEKKAPVGGATAVFDTEALAEEESGTGQETSFQQVIKARASLNLKKLGLVAGGILAVLVVCSMMFSGYRKKKAAELPSMQLTDTYREFDQGYTFRHPAGWATMDRFTESVVTFTALQHSALFFGITHNDKPFTFAVDVVEGMPFDTAIEDITTVDAERIPRVLTHTGNVVGQESVEIAGQQALCLTFAPFEKNAMLMFSKEAFFMEGDRRFILMGFAPAEYSLLLEPVFEQMMNSFTLTERKQKSVPQVAAGDARKKALEAERVGDQHYSERGIRPQNLYRSMQSYKEASMLLGTLEPATSPDSKRILGKLKKAEDELNGKVRELRFKVQQGRRLRDADMLYDAATQITQMIPDENDPRYRDAKEALSELK